MVYDGCDREYAEQVTSEHKVNVRSGGRTLQKWVPKSSHADNHYLDCEVYAMCAADTLGARYFHLEDEEKVKQREPAAQASQTSPEESWIQANESWI